MTSVHGICDISDRWGFPGGLEVKNLPANAGDTHSILGSGISPGEGNGILQPTPVFLPGKSRGQRRSLAGQSPWSHKRVRHDLATTTYLQVLTLKNIHDLLSSEGKEKKTRIIVYSKLLSLVIPGNGKGQFSNFSYMSELIAFIQTYIYEFFILKLVFCIYYIKHF